MGYGISRVSHTLARGRVLAVALSGFVLASCTQVAPSPPHTVYVTEYGLSPDRWATAWLLTRQVAPSSQLRIVQPGVPLPVGAVPFDLLTAQIRREGNRSAFEVALHPGKSRLALHFARVEVHRQAGRRFSESRVEMHQRDCLPPMQSIGDEDRGTSCT